MTSLYNCVEEQAHVLVQRSNVCLEHLEYLLQLRELEAHFQQVLSIDVMYGSVQHVLVWFENDV